MESHDDCGIAEVACVIDTSFTKEFASAAGMVPP